MAQPTVTARPATWAGTSGPILYKFTSTNSGNAGYYMAVEIWNSVTALKVADARFYANTSNVVTVDVSNFLKDNMSLENGSDLTSGSVYTDTNWIRYYIKYREYWTAGSEAQVDDVANLRYAIYGGLQIGVINSYVDYISGDSSKKFVRFAGKGANGLPFTLNAISGTATVIRIDKYLNSSFITGTSFQFPVTGVNRIRVNETAYDRVDFTMFDASTLTYLNGRAVGAGFPFDSLALGVATSTAVAAADFDAINKAYVGTQDVPVILAIEITSTDITGLVTLNFSLYNAAKSSSVNITPIPITANGVYVVSLSSSSFDPEWVELILDNGTAGAVDWTLEVLDSVASETLTISIDEPCDNVVMLQWRNSLGGDECYPFQINQEYTFQYGDRKAKRLTLFAEGLSLTQWEAIQGLNTNGELYKTPITEMLTTDTRTMKTVGQSVNVYNSDGTKTGVNVISQANTTNTKQKTHSAVVTIEYPEIYLQ